MTLLIMAAGNGSRYGALKQFDKLGPKNEFLFEYSIYDALQNGFDHIVIITKEQFVVELKAYLQKRLPKNIKIDVIAQKNEDLPSEVSKTFDRDKPWGTAHAVWVARNLINNGFVVINADDYYGRDAFKRSAEFINKKVNEKQYGLVPYSLKDTLSDHGSVSRGICQVENGLLIGIRELIKIERNNSSIMDKNTNTNLIGDEPTSMNFWIFDPSIFSEIGSQLVEFLSNKANIENGEIYIPLVIQHLIEQKNTKIKLTDASSSWFGITYPEDKSNAIRLLKEMTIKKLYPSPLWRN